MTLTGSQEIERRKASGNLVGTEVAVFGKYWGSKLSIPQPQLPDDVDVGGFYIDYVLARLTKTGEVVWAGIGRAVFATGYAGEARSLESQRAAVHILRRAGLIVRILAVAAPITKGRSDPSKRRLGRQTQFNNPLSYSPQSMRHCPRARLPHTLESPPIPRHSPPASTADGRVCP